MTVADDGFDGFYAATFERLARAVRPTVGVDAEDVAQEALLVAERRWAEVRALERPEAWVRVVADRMARRRARRERDRRLVEAGGPVPAAVAAPDLDLAATLLGLPDRYAAALRLHHLEDRPVAEVAERLGCTEGAARVTLHRARRVLAERLTGINGRWVSDRTWTVDGIARFLRRAGYAEQVPVILDQEMLGRGGRWELTVTDGTYVLLRDDGVRFDHGTSRVLGGAFEMSPELNTGRARYRALIDGRMLQLRLLDTDLPPTQGMPDAVWVRMLFESAAFSRAERGSPTL